jgi:hypothetical protein
MASSFKEKGIVHEVLNDILRGKMGMECAI